MDLTRTCIIIGASGLVGSAVARQLISNGRAVVLTCTTDFSRRRPGLEDLQTERWINLDVRDEVATDSVIDNVAKSSKSGIDLVYCAGIICDRPITQLKSADWRRVMAINVDGAFNCVRSAFMKMAVQGNGSIVLISSISGQRAQVGQSAYAASKAAIEALGRAAAVELGRFNVTCNVVAPGALSGGMMESVGLEQVKIIERRTPLRRLGSAKQVAQSVEFLLGPSATHITGQTLVVDGGFIIT